MASYNSRLNISKVLLLWPTPVPEAIANLFAEVFVKSLELIKYITNDYTKTDTYDLIVHSQYLLELDNDFIYHLAQVRTIDAYYLNVDDLETVQDRLNRQCEKVQFHAIHELAEHLASIGFGNDTNILNLFDRNTMHAITSSMEDRLSVKQPITSVYQSEMIKKLNSIVLHGLPIRNINIVTSYLICQSCKSLPQTLYRLECGHKKCLICLNIQNKCTICLKIIVRNKVLLDQEFHRLLENLPTHCFSCEWKGRIQNYENHFKQNHSQLLTPIVRNLQMSNNSLIISLSNSSIWKVSFAHAQQRKSTYSCSFYLFPHGYKVCLRIFLNGDAKGRNTHMSLFLVLMKGDYDDGLQWPFKAKVTFTLFNHVSINDRQSHCFWSDTNSICFQKPRSDMNIAHGIAKCFCLDLFKNNLSEYVQNGHIYIRTEIDFLAERPNSPLTIDIGEMVNED